MVFVCEYMLILGAHCVGFSRILPLWLQIVACSITFVSCSPMVTIKTEYKALTRASVTVETQKCNNMVFIVLCLADTTALFLIADSSKITNNFPFWYSKMVLAFSIYTPEGKARSNWTIQEHVFYISSSFHVVLLLNLLYGFTQVQHEQDHSMWWFLFFFLSVY